MRYPTGLGTQDDFAKYWYNAEEWNTWRAEGAYYHGGADVNKKTGGNTDCGQPVYAVADGEITHVESISTGFGKHIHLKCVVAGYTIWFHYCHLQDYSVKIGDIVREGQMIGHIGTTGNSTYCHLHFEGKKKPVGVRAVAKTKEALEAGWFDALAFIKANVTVPSTPEPMPINNTLLDYYKVKTEEELIKMIDSQLEFLEDARKRNSELETINRDHHAHLEELANKLGTVVDYPAIYAEVSHLLSIEEVNRKLERQLHDEEIKHDGEVNELIDQIGSLKAAVEKQQKENETLLRRLEALETTATQHQEKQETLNVFKNLLDQIARLFERK